MVYITFCPFYSYKFACWDKVGFYFHMFAIHLIFLAIPLVSVIHSAFYFEQMTDSLAVGWLLTYSLMNVMVIIYYFVLILKVVMGMVKFHNGR